MSDNLDIGLLGRRAELRSSAERACPIGRITSEYAVISRTNNPDDPVLCRNGQRHE